MSHLSVAKFGGTSVANYSAMQACAKIVIADPNTRVVVLSASAGVTNLLVALANGVEAEERAKLIGEVRQIQENILNELKDDSRVRPVIEKYLENITALSEAASLATSLALTDELISHEMCIRDRHQTNHNDEDDRLLRQIRYLYVQFQHQFHRITLW